jgi:DNA-binding transcriptional regulator YiaG
MTYEQEAMLLGFAARYARTGSGKRIREQANIRQQDLAEQIGITPSGLWRWENGQRQPKGEPAMRWAQLLVRLEIMNAQNAA